MVVAQIEAVAHLAAEHGLRAGQHRHDANLEFLGLDGERHAGGKRQGTCAGKILRRLTHVRHPSLQPH
jgi:hypothetical protein